MPSTAQLYFSKSSLTTLSCAEADFVESTVLVAVIVTVPSARGETVPLLTVATFSSELAQVTLLEAPSGATVTVALTA